jgi:tRNA C32,U32 (ribose-2'-O)-methylase TrmJ
MNSPALLDNLRVVLVATRNPLNIGAAARAMSNFGCTHLRLVNPYDPAYREAVSAVGAAPVLGSAEQFSSVAEAVADCALVVGTTAAGRRELHHSLCTLEAGARIILQHLALWHIGRKQPANAKLTGTEVARRKIESKRAGRGKTASAAHAVKKPAPDRVALIPTREEHRSMNLGQAVAVCLYELVRDAKAAAKFKRALGKATPATAGELERFTAILTEALGSSGFLNRRTVADADGRIRRLVRRLNLPSRDADMWTGIMRQIVWKLHAMEKPQPSPHAEGRSHRTT